MKSPRKLPSRQKPARPKRVILDLLKGSGAMEASRLAEHLGVSAMAVRQHLHALEEDRLVTYDNEPRPMGRPVKLWRLTPAADALFPDSHAQLAVSMLEGMREAFGEEGLARLLAVRTRKQIVDYSSRISPDLPLARKVRTLAQIRSREGYMAEVLKQDGGFLLVENHCPICAAARVCQGLCGCELEVFQQVLGPRVRIERTEHIMEGARRCAYAIQGT